MKDYTKRNARYRGIPCYWNPINDEITGRNWFYDLLIDAMMWIDINIFDVDEFPLWVEVDELEKKKQDEQR